MQSKDTNDPDKSAIIASENDGFIEGKAHNRNDSLPEMVIGITKNLSVDGDQSFRNSPKNKENFISKVVTAEMNGTRASDTRFVHMEDRKETKL